MASYNEVDGVPSHANRWLLDDVLRGEWGFDGAVIGDYFAVEQLASLHHVASDLQDAAVQAIEAGVDADLPNGASFVHLGDAVRSGRIAESRIDAAVARMLMLMFRAGLFEQPLADADAAERITHDAAAVSLALRAAERSIVLLKNDGTLPLELPATAGARKPVIAVIGPNAAVARLGSYSGTAEHAVSLLSGVRARVGPSAEVRHAIGVHITDGDDWWSDDVRLTSLENDQRLIAEAVAMARDADTVVLAVGDDQRTCREAWAAHHLGDRAELNLAGQQEDLFDALRALGKPLVVVLINGRPVSSVTLAEGANAVIEAWFPGEQGGTALARILFGDVNPGGKLPLSIPRHAGTLPAFYNHKPSARRGYLFDDVRPLYPFGFGLSYTRFEIGLPRPSAGSMHADGTVNVAVTVRNAGSRSGDEVVQLYVRDKVASVTRPVLQLRGFERITLAPGEERTLRFTITAQDLRMWNRQMQHVVEPGDFEILVGADSQHLQSTTLTVIATPAPRDLP